MGEKIRDRYYDECACADTLYRRLGFDYQILTIANCEFSGACNQKNRKVTFERILLYGTGSTIAIIRITNWLD